MAHLQYILDFSTSTIEKQKPLKALASKGLSGVNPLGLEPGTGLLSVDCLFLNS